MFTKGKLKIQRDYYAPCNAPVQMNSTFFKVTQGTGTYSVHFITGSL